MMATVEVEGTDVSPRGDHGPVIRIHDSKTLMLPDCRGNNRIDSLRNIVEVGRISPIFVLSGVKDVVRVNVCARLTPDQTLCQSSCMVEAVQNV